MKDWLKDLAFIAAATVFIVGAAVVVSRYMPPFVSGDFLIVNGQPAPKGDRLTVINKAGCPTSQEGN